MINSFKKVGIVIVGIAILLILLIDTVNNLEFVKEVKAFEEKFISIREGDQEQEVIRILGAPDAREKEFRIGQVKGYEDAYERAQDSNSEYYLLWLQGIDVVFTVGFKSNEVRIKEYGGT